MGTFSVREETRTPTPIPKPESVALYVGWSRQSWTYAASSNQWAPFRGQGSSRRVPAAARRGADCCRLLNLVPSAPGSGAGCADSDGAARGVGTAAPGRRSCHGGCHVFEPGCVRALAACESCAAEKGRWSRMVCAGVCPMAGCGIEVMKRKGSCGLTSRNRSTA